MAEVKSGSFATSGYSDPGWPDHYVFSWSLASQSIVDNTSTISWSLVGAGADTSGRYTGVKEKYVTVNGSTQSNATVVYTYNGTVAFKGTTVIKHNAEGKAYFSASAGGAFYAYGSYNSTGSGSWTLPTIARATNPTLSATSVTMKEGSITITLTPAVSSFKHKLRYDFGGLTQQVSGFSEGNDFTPSGNRTVTFTPPETLAYRIPNATSGVCSILCYTYNSSGTHIGTVTKTVTLNVPSYEPRIADIKLTGNNRLGETCVQGKSSVNIDITANSFYGAYITSYSTAFDGNTYQGESFKTSVLSSPGGFATRSAVVTVKDSRGKSKTLTSSGIEVYPYAIPVITGFTLTRQSDGTTVTAVVKGTVASVNSENTKKITVTLNGVKIERTPSTYSINETFTFTNVPTDSTLTGTASIFDYYTNVTKDVVLPTVDVTMDFYRDGTGIAMGKVAEKGNLLEVDWNSKFNKAVAIEVPSMESFYINRTDSGNAAAIKFINKNGALGFVGMTGNANEGLKRWTYNAGANYLMLDTGNTKDYVTERGTSGVWTYCKWNSGFAECWGYHTISGVNISTAWGSWYASPVITLPSFPFTFSGAPDVHVSWESDFSAIIDGVGKRESTKAGQVYLYRPVAQTNINGRFSIYAYGKWK